MPLASATALAASALAASALAAATLAAATLAATGTPLASFLLRSGEQTGYRVNGHPATQTSVAAYVNYGGGTTKEKQTETATLLKEGFVAAADEQLTGTHGRGAFSLVVEFTSPTGAQADAGNLFTMAVQGQKGAKLSHFRVNGVPSARGLLARYPGGLSTANVYWTEGKCAFGSGDYVPKQAGPVTPPVVIGVQRLHRRTGGTCP